MGSDKPRCVLVVESDEWAFQGIARHLTIIVSVGLALALLIFGSMYVLFWMYSDQMSGTKLAALPEVLGSIVAIWIIAVVSIRLCTRYFAKRVYVAIGADFLSAPAVLGQFAILHLVVRFSDIRGVNLDVSKGRITGAITGAITGPKVAVSIRRIKDPATVVRAIFEHAGPDVRWRRTAGLWHSWLSRDQVQKLIENSGGKDIDAALHPGCSYVTADEFQSKSGPRELMHLSFDPPTQAERYVNLMLLEMSRDGLRSRALRRFVTLPPIRLKDETVEPPPVDEVVNRLKFMCNLKPKAYRRPIDGTINLTVGEHGQSSFKVTCHFDDKSDACCTIRLEAAETKKEG